MAHPHPNTSSHIPANPKEPLQQVNKLDIVLINTSSTPILERVNQMQQGSMKSVKRVTLFGSTTILN